MSIRTATVDDLPRIAGIHKARCSTHFLGRYSVSLINKFYATYLGRSVFLVHEVDAGIDGFVLGGESAVFSACRKDFIVSNLFACIWETLWRPQLYPAILRRAWRFLFPSQSHNAPVAGVGLLSIVVDENAAGRGIAATLLDAFESTVRNRTSVYELTVRKDNPRAIRFYQKMGFNVEDESRSKMRCVKRFTAPTAGGESRMGLVCRKEKGNQAGVARFRPAR